MINFYFNVGLTVMFSIHVVPLPILQYSKMLFDVALLNRFSERNR